ncbi:hypothetical protein Agabi119p4_7693 [Agaricus bisporus var. burnettii]|uniref:Uncharacterized protein n=1 Tax=Agaricus bisporus var. burnettii TaxID=192524 RepID=A0A8H7C8P5_AGABI|nr:hypothetical protein Agabi119p4_7693 [Agaricus bisporus var. burnettii]
MPFQFPPISPPPLERSSLLRLFMLQQHSEVQYSQTGASNIYIDPNKTRHYASTTDSCQHDSHSRVSHSSSPSNVSFVQDLHISASHRDVSDTSSQSNVSVTQDSRRNDPQHNVSDSSLHGHHVYTPGVPHDTLTSETHMNNITIQETAILRRLCDTLSAQLSLKAEQTSDLRTVIEAYPKNSKGFVWTSIYQLSLSFANINTVQQIHEDSKKIRPTLEALHTRYVTYFDLSNHQMDHIYLFCKSMVFDHCRYNYKDSLAPDVAEHIKKNAQRLGFPSMEGIPVYENVLSVTSHKKASTARNRFRQLIVKTLHPKPMPLDKAIAFCGEKLKAGGNVWKIEYQFRMAILRRFAKDFYRDGFTDHDAQDSDEEVNADVPTGTKRKAMSSRCVPNGKDFWSQADILIANKWDEYGENFKGEKWAEYYRTLIARDHAEWGRPQGLPQVDPLPLDYTTSADHTGGIAPWTTATLTTNQIS